MLRRNRGLGIAGAEAIANVQGVTDLVVRPDGVVALACGGEPSLAEAAAAGDRWLAAAEKGAEPRGGRPFSSP